MGVFLCNELSSIIYSLNKFNNIDNINNEYVQLTPEVKVAGKIDILEHFYISAIKVMTKYNV